MVEHPLASHQNVFIVLLITYFRGAFANDGGDHTCFVQRKIASHGQWPWRSQYAEPWDEGLEDEALDQEFEQAPKRLGLKKKTLADPEMHKMRVNLTRHEQTNKGALQAQELYNKNQELTGYIEKLKTEIGKLSSENQAATDDATVNLQTVEEQREKLKWSAAKADEEAKEIQEQIDELSEALRQKTEEGIRLKEEKTVLQTGLGEVAENLKATISKVSDH